MRRVGGGGGEVKMAHLAARSHLKLEFRGSSPTIGKIVKFMSVYCIEKTKIDTKRPKKELLK